MARKATPRKEPAAEPANEAGAAFEQINLAKFMSTKAVFQPFRLWIVGTSPLICHAWSKKAKDEMLQKQVKALKAAKPARDPEQEFIDSLYEMGEPGEGVFGIPAIAIKKALLSVAHKDKGIPATLVKRSLWISAKYVSTRPAMAAAICDMPLLRLWGADPVMREDAVKIGSGLRKTAMLAYRAQFWPWAVRVNGRINASVLNTDILSFLIEEAGAATGICDWRNEKDGPFGSFRLAKPEEARAWSAYARGEGPLPEYEPEADVEDDFLEAAE